MTKDKQFTLTNPNNVFQNMKCGINYKNKTLSFNDAVSILNKLNNENKQLNQEMYDLGTAHAEEITKIEDEFDEEILRLVKENNQLKSKFSAQLDSLKDENNNLKKENKDLEELLRLITGIFSFEKEDSVKELLRNEIRGLDTVSYEFAGAWNDYCILSKFFRERYGEDWDNE